MKSKEKVDAMLELLGKGGNSYNRNATCPMDLSPLFKFRQSTFLANGSFLIKLDQAKQKISTKGDNISLFSNSLTALA